MDTVVREVRIGDPDELVRIVGDRKRVQVRLDAALAGVEDMLVAVVDSSVRGTVSIRWANGCDDGLPWLFGAEVERPYRDRGIGTALWHAAAGAVPEPWCLRGESRCRGYEHQCSPALRTARL